MSRDKYGRGPVRRTVDKAIAGVSSKRIAEFMFSVFLCFAMLMLLRLGLEIWEQVLVFVVLMFLSGAAYAVGTCDATGLEARTPREGGRRVDQ